MLFWWENVIITSWHLYWRSTLRNRSWDFNLCFNFLILVRGILIDKHLLDTNLIVWDRHLCIYGHQTSRFIFGKIVWMNSPRGFYFNLDDRKTFKIFIDFWLYMVWCLFGRFFKTIFICTKKIKFLFVSSRLVVTTTEENVVRLGGKKINFDLKIAG